MSKLKSESVDAWEAQKKELQNRQDEKKAQIARVQETIWNDQKEIEKLREDLLEAESGIAEQRRKLAREFSRAETESKDGGGEQSEDGIAAAERVGVIETSVRYEEEFQRYLSGRKSVNYDYLKRQRLSDLYPLREAEEVSYQKLVEERSSYVRSYPNRTFSTAIKENTCYDELLESLSCDDLEAFRESAKEQARSAVEHFKDDFIFKIRSAIREAYQRN